MQITGQNCCHVIDIKIPHQILIICKIKNIFTRNQHLRHLPLFKVASFGSRIVFCFPFIHLSLLLLKKAYIYVNMILEAYYLIIYNTVERLLLL